MGRLIRLRLAPVFTALIWLAILASGAEARNVPGSAAAASEALSERASNDLADQILDALGSDGPTIGGVSRDALGNVAFSSIGATAYSGAGAIAGGSFNYRSVDRDGEYEGDLVTGALSFGHTLENGMMVYASLLLERLDVDTPYNSGTLEGAGSGLALGLKSTTATGLDLSAMIASMWLEYDMTRSNGAVSGDYASQRWWLDLRASNTVSLGQPSLSYAFGLRHVSQTDESYREDGGGDVPSTSYGATSAFLNTRTYLGSGAVQPYVQGDVRYVAGSSDDVPGEASGGADGFVGFLGFGLRGGSDATTFDLGVGAHFEDEEYSGTSARLSVDFRF